MQRNTSLIIGGLVIILGLVGLSIWQRSAPTSTPIIESASQSVTEVRYACSSDQTALVALEEHHQISAKDTDFGRQVMGIDSRAAGDHEFWAFYVNGAPASVGADSYQCQENDQIKWQIETF